MNMLRSRYLLSSIALIALVLLLQLTPALAAQNPNPGVLPPDSHPFGKTYGEWSNAWWQWAYSIPAPNNPVLDTTGANCDVGQSGQVWFLAGSFTSGTIRLGMLLARAATAIGKAPRIGLTRPSSDNSPTETMSVKCSALPRSPFAPRIPRAIGRSKLAPSLRMSAGARLIVVL